MPKYLVYDCEILKCIPPKDAPLNPAYEYCKGWGDLKGMGVSVVSYARSDGGEVAIAPHQDYGSLKMFEKECQDCLVIGFNSRNFDDKLMQAHGLNVTTDYDILKAVRIVAFGSSRWQDCPKGNSYALGKIGESNGFPKTGNGELAPELWQQGKHDDVINYCLNDVRLTRHILALGLTGLLKDPNNGKLLTLPPLPEKSKGIK